MLKNIIIKNKAKKMRKGRGRGERYPTNVWEIKVTYNDTLVIGIHKLSKVIDYRGKIKFTTVGSDIDST